MISPTIGRVVLVRNLLPGYTEAMPALVARVWGARCINVGGFDQNGAPFSFTSLVLLQDDDAPPSFGPYAEWMPYQKGHAAKTEALQAARPTFSYDIDEIARVAHEVNRAYCQALGDASQPAWDDAPEWQRSSAYAGVQLHLANPDAGPQASHESWMAQKVAEGWVYGPEKNPELKQHHCLVPFDQLPREQQAKDYLFRGVVHALTPA